MAASDTPADAESEPGSQQVLRKRWGLTSAREMDCLETYALLSAIDQLLDEIRVDQRFAARDAQRGHRR